MAVYNEGRGIADAPQGWHFLHSGMDIQYKYHLLQACSMRHRDSYLSHLLLISYFVLNLGKSAKSSQIRDKWQNHPENAPNFGKIDQKCYKFDLFVEFYYFLIQKMSQIFLFGPPKSPKFYYFCWSFCGILFFSQDTVPNFGQKKTK